MLLPAVLVLPYSLLNELADLVDRLMPSHLLLELLVCLLKGLLLLASLLAFEIVKLSHRFDILPFDLEAISIKTVVEAKILLAIVLGSVCLLPKDPELPGDVLNFGDPLGPIGINHKYTFDSIGVALDILEMSSHDVVMLVHIEIQLQVFDEIQSQSQDLLLLHHLSRWPWTTLGCLGFVAWHQRYEVVPLFLQSADFSIDSGQFSL